jgi:hypothetical protein
MPRSETELRRTQGRLQLVVKLAREELEEVEAELAALKGQARLNENFFWRYMVDIIRSREKGITSSELFEVLTADGHIISNGALRVFLTRYKQRGKLTFGRLGQGRWELSPSTASGIAKLESEASRQK